MEARNQENSHSVEGGENHEKKPVLKRAKDKANKIKSRISKMAHGHHADGDHEHDHDHDNDDDVVSEEGEVYEEAEEEREAAPEVHGAPMYESEAARQFAGGRDENLGPGKAMATTTVEDPSRPKDKRFGTTAASDASTDTGTADGERRNIIRDRDENIVPQTVTSRATAGSVEDELSASKAMTGTPAAATQPSHPSDPFPKGGDEVGESPLLSSFQEMAVSDKPKGTEGVLESPPTRLHVRGEPDKPLQDAPKEGTEEQMSSSNTNKISSTTTATAAKDAAVSGAIGSAKPKDAERVLESPPAGTHDQFSPDKPKQDAPKEGTEEQKSSSYKDKISSTAATAKDVAVSGAIGSAVYGKKIASTVYGKVSEAGTAIMGKGMNQEEKNDDIKTRQPVNKGVSVKDYVVGKLRPGDEDRALSEVISDAMHTKKQEAVGGAPEGVKGPEPGSSEENGESGSGKGMVEKIKGAVTSWIGAGRSAGSARDSPTGGAARDSPTTTTMADTDSKEKEA